MKTIKDYSIIETEWIDDRISIYKQYIKDLSKEHGFEISWVKAEIERHKSILSEYEILKSKLKPLIPIVENAYDAGILDKEFSLCFDNPKGRYIDNTIIE